MNPRRMLLLMGLLPALAGCPLEQLVRDGGPGPTPSGNSLELHRQGMEAYARGDLQTAEKAFRQLVERVPKDADLWFRLGNIYARTQRPDDAVYAYRQAVLRQPNLSKAWHNMGVVHMRQALNSYVEMHKFVDPKDPLYQRGAKMAEDLVRLLGEDPAAAGIPAVPGPGLKELSDEGVIR